MTDTQDDTGRALLTALFDVADATIANDHEREALSGVRAAGLLLGTCPSGRTLVKHVGVHLAALSAVAVKLERERTGHPSSAMGVVLRDAAIAAARHQNLDPPPDPDAIAEAIDAARAAEDGAAMRECLLDVCGVVLAVVAAVDAMPEEE